MMNSLSEDLERFRRGAEVLATVLTGAAGEEVDFTPAPDKWSIRQVLNHITDTERSFTFRALWFARGFDTPLPSYDQNIAVAGAQADDSTWATHIEDFRRVRLATTSLFASMPPGAWLRRGIASNNPFTVRSLAFICAGHLTHHIRILRERYL